MDKDSVSGVDPVDSEASTESEVSTTRQSRRSSREGLQKSIFGTRNLLAIAALSVVGLIILIPLNYISVGFAATPAGLAIVCLIMGVWYVPYALPAAIVKKPGASLLAGFIIGVISTFTTPSGAAAILGNVIGAAFIEIGLLIFRYRRWDMLSFSMAALVFGGLNGASYAFVILPEGSIWVRLGLLAISLVSSLIGAFIVSLIAKKVQLAGAQV